MVIWYWGLIGLVLVVFVVVPGAVFVMNRGKLLRCPDCARTFRPPLMDSKRIGLGATMPYLGYVACPGCGERRSRRDYQVVAQDAVDASAGAS